jgi:hypothetical protein
MKPLKPILLLILLIAVYSSHAQNRKNTCVNLKNGSIIYGKVIENYPDSLIKIQTEGNNIWVFKYSDIDTVITSSTVKTESARPYTVQLQAGFAGFGGSYNFNPGISLLISGSYEFKDRYYIGLTSGAEYFDIPILPVVLDVKVDFFKRNLTPFVYLRGGYAFKLISDQVDYYEYKTSYKGGIMYDAGFGVKKRFSSEFALTFSIGYAHRETYEVRDYIYDSPWTTDYERHYFYNRAAFMIGIVF